MCFLPTIIVIRKKWGENMESKTKLVNIPLSMPIQEIFAGFKESVPLLVGVIPFGITCGIMGLSSGLTKLETILMSVLVFAGASQFVSFTIFAQGVTSLGLIAFTTLLINLRHLLMGASLAAYMNKLPGWQQALLAFGMVDETYAITMTKAERDGYSAGHQLGSNLTAYSFWVFSTIAGAELGSYISNPLAWGLDFAMPATFLALLIPRILNKTGFMVFSVAAVTAVLGAVYLPGKWYIIIACAAASLLGGLLEEAGENAV
jgi:4-azaleucine resistance transporter AzlC